MTKVKSIKTRKLSHFKTILCSWTYNDWKCFGLFKGNPYVILEIRQSVFTKIGDRTKAGEADWNSLYQDIFYRYAEAAVLKATGVTVSG